MGLENDNAKSTKQKCEMEGVKEGQTRSVVWLTERGSCAKFRALHHSHRATWRA
jgi:hypothetical protein